MRAAADMIVLFVACSVAMAGAAEPQELRMWSYHRGKTVEARLVMRAGTAVILERADGNRMAVSATFLSPEDTAYLEAVTAGTHVAEPAPPAPAVSRDSRSDPVPADDDVAASHAGEQRPSLPAAASRAVRRPTARVLQVLSSGREGMRRALLQRGLSESEVERYLAIGVGEEDP